jgi:hypothetical protein
MIDTECDRRLTAGLTLHWPLILLASMLFSDKVRIFSLGKDVA